MSDELGDRLAAAIDGAAAPVTATEATTRGKRYARRRVAVTAGVAVVVVLAGVAVASAATHRSSGPKVFVGDTTTSTTAKPAPLSAHIELPSTTIVAGRSEIGHLVIENNTGAAARLSSEPLCSNWSVVLRNRDIPQEAAFEMKCAPLPLVVRAGETRWAFTLLTTYQGCSSTGYPQGALTPNCLPDANGNLNTPPPLPVGLYQATFFSRIPNFPTVTPVPVHVVSGSSHVVPLADAENALTQFLAGQPDVVVHSAPVAAGDTVVALIGTEVDALHRGMVVLSFAGDGTVKPLAKLTLPGPDYDFARALPVQVADMTGDGMPDFLVRFQAADNQPGVVVSADGGKWRLVPESSDPADVYIGRDLSYSDGQLQSSRNDCVPTCAQGHTTTVTWRYDGQTRTLVPQ